MSLKDIGKTGKNVGKALFGSVESFGSKAISGADAVGSRVVNSFSKNTALSIGAVATAGITGGLLADADGNTDVGKTAFKGATVGALATAVPGGAAALGAIGTASVGAAVMGASAVGAVGSKLIKTPKTAINISNIGEVGMTGLGKFAFTGAALVQGVQNGIKAFEKSRMGVNDGLLRSQTPTVPQMTPQTPSYANNAGATGDLVFAMHKNR